MRYPFATWPLLCLAACSGPDAPDAAVCQDVVIRLCQTAACPGVSDGLGVPIPCESTLLERTGCGAEEFTFSTPTRERFLDCREPLLSRGTTTERPPACEDTTRLLTTCPDVADFFRGGQP
ncbi:hypothetical protein [Pyxidicoccus xibeiensis]|uniref:hypothetical protein n=1 Tax=Pyxidicoccus xibeiensis TaxID=2906759 RepID=UPI0020A80FA3|nr:hypothetical protein [Pyxidicoccus xibeiensis]MCP3139173.1 hypothetical protein [Pyxidicoccus xibeiensis]